MVSALLVGVAVLAVSVFIFGWTTALMVRIIARFFRPGHASSTIWMDLAIMMLVSLMTAAVHLLQIGMWSAVLLLTGESADFDTAFYSSAQNYTALGYGDIAHSERWRLLGPMEAINGLLLFGISTATMFSVMSRLITNRLHFEHRMAESRREASSPGELEP